jgi:murein L,D-transpeptidase YafK
VGCYAMTDAGIAEIYALARETFKGGNPSFQLQIFPFRMTATNMAQHADSQHLEFWKNIKQGHDLFEVNKTPPAWDVCDKRYIFNAVANGPLNPLGPCPATTPDAGLMAKQQADDATLANALAARDRQAAEEAAIKARGEAVNGFFSGIGNMFGSSDANVAPVMSGKSAPQPQSPLPRS